MPFTFTPTEIPEVILVQPGVFPDDRGAFAEVFKYSDFAAAGIGEQFVQINYSRSKKDVIRALHYQLPPKAQAKLVQVTRGSAFDVAVDIRKNSPTYGKWVAATLTAEQKNMLYIPKGFAHGFCALEDDTEFVYYCSDEYSKEHEGGIIWNDPTIGVTWPTNTPILSDKDAASPTLEQATNTFDK